MEVKLPCGQCIGCRLERSRQWAIRCVHEASLHKENCFITLTYDEEHIPKDHSLNKRDFTLFMKKLRKKYGSKIRFFMCGEYGDQLLRPHYHACLFNFRPPDLLPWAVRADKITLYRSAAMEKLWSRGYVTVGDVSFESAAYVARYVVKKVTGSKAADYYRDKLPEYTNQSRRPGIAAGWLEKYKTDVYPLDKIVIRDGTQCRPPRYYDKIYDVETAVEMKPLQERIKSKDIDISQFDLLKHRRQTSAKKGAEHQTLDRLIDREAYKREQIKTLSRSYESGC